MKDYCFTESCGFLSYINKNEPWVHSCPHPPDPPSHLPPHPNLQPVTESLFEFPKSYGKFPWAIYFTYGIVNFHVTPSHISPSPSSPTRMSMVCSLCLFLHCCPENKFISTIFLDSIYMSLYSIYLSLSDLLHSV